MEKGAASKKGFSAARVLLSAAAGALLGLAILLGESILVSMEKIPPDIGKVYISVSLVAAAALSSYILAKSMSGKKALAALASAVALEVILLAAGLLAGGGSISGGSLPVQLLCIAAGSITGCILTVGKKKRKRR